MSESYDLPEPPLAVVIQSRTTEFEVWKRDTTATIYSEKVATFTFRLRAERYAEDLNKPKEVTNE
jgi:hypothetical protein